VAWECPDELPMELWQNQLACKSHFMICHARTWRAHDLRRVDARTTVTRCARSAMTHVQRRALRRGTALCRGTELWSVVSVAELPIDISSVLLR
jgi:hypothetical protein